MRTKRGDRGHHVDIPERRCLCGGLIERDASLCPRCEGDPRPPARVVGARVKEQRRMDPEAGSRPTATRDVGMVSDDP